MTTYSFRIDPLLTTSINPVLKCFLQFYAPIIDCLKQQSSFVCCPFLPPLAFLLPPTFPSLPIFLYPLFFPVVLVCLLCLFFCLPLAIAYFVGCQQYVPIIIIFNYKYSDVVYLALCPVLRFLFLVVRSVLCSVSFVFCFHFFSV